MSQGDNFRHRPYTGPAVNETPRKYHRIHESSAHTQGLVEMRKNLVKASTNHLISCPTDDWFATYAKYTDIAEWNNGEWDTLVDRIHATLLKQKVIRSDGWKSIRDMTAKHADEDTTFQGIGNIAEAVHEAAISHKPTLHRTTVVQCCPRERTNSEVPGSSNLPDARATLAFPTGPLDPPTDRRRRSDRIAKKAPANYKGPNKLVSDLTIDTAMTAEFKLDKKPETRGQNEAQILGGASHILYNDPRRRFVYGLTIEHNIMRFWHFSRSHIAITAGFDYHKNPRHFIRFLLFILFAPTVALGFDPTVQRIRDDNKKIAYLYQVGDDWYQTVGNSLSEQACLPIVTRATRVWEVRKVLGVDSEGKRLLAPNVCVLKDVWLFDDVKGERAIQDAIFSNLRKIDEDAPIGTSRVAEEARPYFMTILEDEAVQVNGQDDITPGPCQIRDSIPFTKAAAKEARPATVEGAQRESNPAWARHTQATKTEQPLRHTPRIHRRTIFKERCDTIYDLHDFRDLVQMLQHVIQGLWYMRLAGYVHRDISGGNCMWYRTTGQGKISDLEFAKSYAQIACHDFRTGTPQFVAVEVQAKKFLLRPVNKLSAAWAAVYLGARAANEVTLPMPFTFNFFHDLESALWIYVWFTFHRMPLVDVDAPPPTIEELKNLPPKPTAFNPDSKPRTLYDQIQNIENIGRDLFDCDIDGSPARSSFVTKAEAGEVAEILRPMYGHCMHLTKGIFFVHSILDAFISLEKSVPVTNFTGIPTWDVDLFTYEPYGQFQQLLQQVLDDIKKSGQATVTPIPGLQVVPTVAAPQSIAKRGHATIQNDDAPPPVPNKKSRIVRSKSTGKRK